MFCSNCGNEINEDGKFCSNCGQLTKKDAIPASNTSTTPPEKVSNKKSESNNWSVIITLALIGLAIIYGSAFIDGFTDGMSSDPSSPSTYSSNKYSHVIVDSQGGYEYSKSSNENIIVNCYFDTTNIGTAGADNVQVDYSLTFNGRVLTSSTLYLGSIPAGSNIHREKSHSISLTNSEWKQLVNGFNKINIDIGEIRSN